MSAGVILRRKPKDLRTVQDVRVHGDKDKVLLTVF